MRARFVFCSLILAVAVAHGQTDNTVYVKVFPGATVGAKVAVAMATCNPSTVIPCILVIDPSLAGYAPGTMPTLCPQCTLQDFRTNTPALVSSSMNGALNAASCGAANPPSWCSGSDLGAWIAAAITALPNGGRIVVPAGSYQSHDWVLPANQTPNKSWEIWGDGRSTVVNMKAGSTYWLNASNTQGVNIHDMTVVPVAGMSCMVYMHGANQVSVYDSYLGYTTDPQVNNGINGYCLAASIGFGNYQNTFEGNTLAYLTGQQLSMTDTSTDASARNDRNAWLNEWWWGDYIGGVYYGSGIVTQSGMGNFIVAYAQSDATCMQTSIGPGGTQFYGNLLQLSCDPPPPASLVDLTGSYGNHFEFTNNMSSMDFAARMMQGTWIQDVNGHSSGLPGATNNIDFGETDIYSTPYTWTKTPPISVGASPSTWTNSTGYTVGVDIWGGVVTNITVNGVTTTSRSPQVPNGQSVVVTYTSAPEMRYREPFPRIWASGTYGVCFGDGVSAPTSDVCIGANGSKSSLYLNGYRIMDGSGQLYSANTQVSDTSGNLKAGSGSTIVYRCSAAGNVRLGGLTTNSSDCGTAVDSGLRTK